MTLSVLNCIILLNTKSNQVFSESLNDTITHCNSNVVSDNYSQNETDTPIRRYDIKQICCLHYSIVHQMSRCTKNFKIVPQNYVQPKVEKQPDSLNEREGSTKRYMEKVQDPARFLGITKPVDLILVNPESFRRRKHN